MTPLNVFAEDTGSGSLPGTGPREITDDGFKNTRWPLGNLPLIDMFSGESDRGTASTGIKYLKTDTDNQGRTYMEFKITQVGVLGSRGQVSYRNLSGHSGYWADLILHFDDALFESIDLDSSYILGEKNSNGVQRRFNLSNREKGNADPYNTDGKSATIKFFEIFNKGDQWKKQEATLRLYTKKGLDNKLVPGDSYVIDYRVGTKPSDRSGYYFRNFMYGHRNNRNLFNYPDYIHHTASMNFEYQSTITRPNYSDRHPDDITNVHSEIYVDWDKKELHVNYLYENLEDFQKVNAQFVQIIPKALLDCLVPRTVKGKDVVAKFNHVYKFGNTDQGGDEGISLFETDFTLGTRNDDLTFTQDNAGSFAAYRLQRPWRGYEYESAWNTIKALGKADEYGVPQAIDMRTLRGRYLAESISYGALSNHTAYYIDPVKFRQNFKNIDDLTIDSFFVVKNSAGQGAILKNSDSLSTPNYFKATTNSPQVEDIYDDSKEVNGKTGYDNRNQNVFIQAKNYKEENDPNKQKFTNDYTQDANSDGSFTLISGKSNGVFTDMQKDDKLTFETIYQFENHFKSAPTVKKVKSRIHFLDYEADPENPDKRVEKVVEVPEGTLFRGQTGYTENGLDDNMPENPTKEGYIFKGWATKPISAKDYTAQDTAATGNVDKVKTLRDIKDWAEETAFKFDKDSPINKSYQVYPVWEEEVKTFKIVLHKNYDTDETKVIEVNYGENLPSLTELTSKSLTQDQYAAIASGNYSEKAILPNAYQVDDKDKGIFGKRDKFNFVGWSTSANNDGIMIEDLYSNKAMLAAEGEGNDRKFYLSTVKTSGRDIGQASASKQFKELEITGDEVHLYAAWKPYFHMTVNKSWYDTSSKDYEGAYVNDILSAIAHNKPLIIKGESGQQDRVLYPATSAKKDDLARNVWVGLLYRTAVTEANKPTVTGDANYYIVENSIKPLKTDTNSAQWDLPSYDGYGKRLSYIAAEFKDEATAKAAFDKFNQKWNNIWTNVGNNLDDISKWDNTTIAKVQNVELNQKSPLTGVDAFTAATVRTLKEDDKDILEKDTNKSTVGSKPTYTTSLYNVKSSMAYPNFKKIFDGATEVELIPSTDKSVQVVAFDIPSEVDPVYFKRQNDGSWIMAKPISTTGWQILADQDKYTFALDNTDPKDPSWVLKYNLKKYPRLARLALRTGDTVKAKYFGANPTVGSIWSQQTVENQPVTPILNGLEQRVKEKDENGKEYVVIRAVKPNADLGQFKENPTITLIHHDKAKEGGLVEGEAYKDAKGNDVTATEKGDYYYFRVPIENIKHGDKVGAHGHQDAFIDSRSTKPLTIDLEGPVITADNQTVFKGEDIDVAKAVSTDERAKLDNGALPKELSLKQKENADLGTEWRLQGKAENNGETTVKLTATDQFGNTREKTDWKITVVDRPTTDSIDKDNKDNAKQITNKHNNFRDIYHRIEIKTVIKGSIIKLYLNDPTTSTLGSVFEAKVPEDQNGPFILEIPEKLGKNIHDAKVFLTQTEEGKKESKATEVAMDVIPPAAPTITANPAENFVTLSEISSDTDKIYLEIANDKYTIEKSIVSGSWLLTKPDKDEVEVKENPNGTIKIDLNYDLTPKMLVSLTAIDAMINPSGAQKYVAQYEKPEAPTIKAGKKGDFIEVTGKSKYPGEEIRIYTVKTTIDQATKEESKEYTLVKKVFTDAQGNYIANLEKGNYDKDAVFASSVVVHGIESDRAEAKLIEDSDVIPFDPTDPSKPNNPDPDKYVTVTLNANDGKFLPGTKSSFYVKKTHILKVEEFEDAKNKLQAPIDKTFDKWTEDKAGKTAYVEKAFTEDATIYASYKADGNIIPFDPNDPNGPTPNPDPNKYATVTLDANGGSFEQGTKYAFHVKKDYTLTTNDFAVAEKGLKAQEGKAFTAWYLDKAGTNPFPAEGKKFDADATVYAAYKEDRDIVPVDDETKPPLEGYVRVIIEKDDTSVKFTAQDVKHSYDVKLASKVRYADVTAKVAANPQEGYKDLKWYEKDQANNLTLADNAKVIDKAVTLYAKASNDKNIIPVEPGKEDDPTTIPDGYVRVKFVADGTSVTAINGIKAYDIKADGSVRYKDLIDKVTDPQSKTTFVYADGYRQPLIFKIGEADLVMTAYPVNNTDIKVSATQKDAGKYEAAPVIQDVKQGDTPKAENSIGNKNELPDGTTYEFVDDQGNKTTPKTDKIGEQDVKVKVTYPDKSSETVPTKINVVPKDDIIDVTDPDNTPIPRGYIRVKFMDDASVTYGANATRACDIRESALATVKYSSLWIRTTVKPTTDYREPISWYLKGKTDAITVDRLVKDDVKADTKVLEITPKATQTDSSKYDPKGQELKVTQGSTIEAKDFISNKDDMPKGTKYDFVDNNGDPVTPDTNTLGKQDLKIKVTFPDKSTKTVPAKMDVVPKDNIVKVKDPDNTPVPTDFVRVTLVNDTKSVKDFKETYDVKVEAKIKYGDVLLRAADPQPNDKYTTPITWKMNNNPVDKLSVIADTSTLTAFAKLKDSETYDPKVQDQTVKQGDTPKAEDSISNKDKLPDGTKYEFVDKKDEPANTVTPNTDKPGEEKPYVRVTYPDGSGEIVGPTTIKVVPDKDIIPVPDPSDPNHKTPDGYVMVTLTKDDKSVDFKADAITSYDVKADGTVLYSQVVANVEAKAKDGYKNLKWYKDANEVSLLDKVRGTVAITLNAKAENADKIIPVKPEDESKPAREGYVRVKLTHDNTVTFQAGAETAYDVKNDGSVRYADVTAKVGAQAKDGYKNLTWYEGTKVVTGTEIVKTALTLNAKAENAKSIIPVPNPDDENQKTPEGYVRVTLSHDDTVTFAANVVTTYDVKADGIIRYSDVCDQVKAQAKQGFADMKWYKDDRAITLTDKLTETTAFELIAKAVHSDSIIPVKPGEENTTVTPPGYVRVNLTKDENSVKFTATNAPTSYDVKADGTVLLADVYAKVQAVPVEGYKDLTWYKGTEEVKITERVTGNTAITLEAKAVKDLRDGIMPVKPEDENKPSPKGYVRVSIKQGDGLVSLTGIKAYEVKNDGSVRYSDIAAKVKIDSGDTAKETVVTIKDEYQKPLTFKLGGNDVDITDYPAKATELYVGATEKDSNKYQPEVQDQRVNQGDTPDPADSIKNKDDLPDGTKYEFVDPSTSDPTKPDTSKPGEQNPNIKVTYPDGTSEIVGPAKIIVDEKKPAKPIVEPIKEGDDKVVVIPPRDGDKVIVTLPDGTTVEASKDPISDTWRTPDLNPDGSQKTDPNGDPMTKEVTKTEDGKLEIPVDKDKVKPGDVKVVVEDTKTGNKSEPAIVKVQELERIVVETDALGRGTRRIFIKTSVPDASVEVKIAGKLLTRIRTDGLGEYNLSLNDALTSRQKIELIATKEGYNSGRYVSIIR